MPSSLALAPDGSIAVGDAVTGVWAFEADGQPVPVPGDAGGAAFALDGGMAAVGPGPAAPAGGVSLFDAAGAIWSEPAVGPVTVVGSPSRVLVLDAGSGTGTLLAVDGGGVSPVRLPALRAIGPSAGALLDNAGDLLLYNQQGVAWFPARNREPRWTVPAKTSVPVRQLALSPGGLDVTAATGQGDDTLYQFSLQGSSPGLIWTQPLAPGGSNLLAVAPGGNIAVWDVGGGPTIAVYRASDGARLWQDTLGSGPGAGPTLVALAFGPEDGVVAAVDDCHAGDPCLLFLGPTGAALGYAPLPGGSRVALSGNGLAAVAAAPAAGVDSAVLSWWNLSPLWQSLLSATIPPAAAASVLAPAASRAPRRGAPRTALGQNAGGRAGHRLRGGEAVGIAPRQAGYR